MDLAACYRLVAHYGMSDMVYNHISSRVPGEEGQLLINAYGMLYEEITASSLMKIDFEGRVVLDSATASTRRDSSSTAPCTGRAPTSAA